MARNLYLPAALGLLVGILITHSMPVPSWTMADSSGVSDQKLESIARQMLTGSSTVQTTPDTVADNTVRTATKVDGAEPSALGSRAGGLVTPESAPTLISRQQVL